MEVLKIFSECSLSYPLGDNIRAAISFASNAATTFNSIPDFKHQRINIICRGSSGAMLAALFASFLVGHPIEIYHIKKRGEISHASQVPVISSQAVNIIIDDFISSGETLREIYKGASEWINKVDCVVIERGFRKNLGFIPDYLICCSHHNL